MMFAVLLYCPTGTIRLVDSTATGLRWERVYHWITWTVEPDEQTALKVAADLTSGLRGVSATVRPHPVEWTPWGTPR